ncbi:hypothetical protein [Aquisphaera insulae]|uniref:hypothetical protein n=1 Tax=Aquisphaera insulae TaxID=2712864 RepID=UPI0013EBDE0D|nr:hypothetical protein [Aquisphaera insulae]
MSPGEPGAALDAKASGDRPELGRTLGIVALAILMGLTSWVVASVSTWMVPAYVTAMVLIFAIPRAPRRDGNQGEAPEARGDEAEPPADLGRPVDVAERPRRGRKASSRSRTRASSEGMAPGEGTEDGNAGLRVDDPEAALDPATDPAEPTAARPRRTRGRARRTARPGVEPVLAPAPATWIQVAPGKFVRADLEEPRPEDADPGAPAGASDVTSEVEPASPMSADALAAPAEAPEPGSSLEPPPQRPPSASPDLPEEPDPSDEPEADDGPFGDLDPAEGPEMDVEPDAEEYGIAPSALGDDPQTTPPPEDETALTAYHEDDEGSPWPPPGESDVDLDADEWDRDERFDEYATEDAALAMDAIAGQGRGDDECDRASTADGADVPDGTGLDRRRNRRTPASRTGSPVSSRASLATAVRLRNIRPGSPARPRVLKASPPQRGPRTPSRRNAGRRPGFFRHLLPRSPPLRA